MKNVMKLGLTLAAALVITACGSSGGNGDNNAKPDQPKANSQTQPSTPAQPQNNTAKPSVPSAPSVQKNPNSSGAAVALNGNNKVVELDGKSLSEITVDGKKIAISVEGISSGKWTTMSHSKINGKYYEGLRSCCGVYSDVRFGIVANNGTDYAFYTGNPTAAASVPTQGSAQYNGYSIINKSYATGKSTFNVDFAAKTVKGTLDIGSLKPIEISANIAGNGFDGTAKSGDFKNSAKVEGKFFGTDAKEIGGLAHASDWSAAFGGSK